MFTDAGFASDIKIWPQLANFNMRSGKEFVDRFIMATAPPGSIDSELANEIARLYDSQQGDTLSTFELQVVLVFKD